MFYLSFLIWPIVIIGLIVFVIVLITRRRRNKGTKEKDWHLQVAFSKNDLVSQFFFLFSILFLGILILKLNRNLGDILSWQTVF